MNMLKKFDERYSYVNEWRWIYKWTRFETDGDIESVCIRCANRCLVPDFIYDEFCRYVAHNELNGEEVATIYCNVCGSLKMIPIKILDKN